MRLHFLESAHFRQLFAFFFQVARLCDQATQVDKASAPTWNPFKGLLGWWVRLLALYYAAVLVLIGCRPGIKYQSCVHTQQLPTRA